MIVPPRDVEGLGQVRVEEDGCGERGLARGVDRDVAGDGLVAVGRRGVGSNAAEVRAGALRVRLRDYREAGEP